MTQLDFHNEFDTVFSNAVLHWVRQPEKALKNIYTSLKKAADLLQNLAAKEMFKRLLTLCLCK